MSQARFFLTCLLISLLPTVHAEDKEKDEATEWRKMQMEEQRKLQQQQQPAQKNPPAIGKAGFRWPDANRSLIAGFLQIHNVARAAGRAEIEIKGVPDARLASTRPKRGRRSVTDVGGFRAGGGSSRRI